ncbi:MAG: SusC/RagA family TonB-linked outer membrane protein, partial [Sphingobacteriales bacterium]
MQKLFGSGSTSDVQVYNQYENQQYGPAFDGSIKPVGLAVEDGSIQELPYQWNEGEGKNAFWDKGFTNQTDISLSSGTNKGSLYFSAQYLNATGTIPGDKYNRATVRVNGTQNIVPILDLNYSAYYAQNRYNTTSQTSGIYNNVLNSPGQVPLTRYNDWQNDKFSSPDGYYNAYYTNPYFLADNYRSLTRNDYFVGNASLVLKPVKGFDLTSRLGFTTRNVTGESTADVYSFSDYTKAQSAFAGTYKVRDLTGSYGNNFSYSTKIIYDLVAHTQQNVGDFKLDLTGAFNLIQQKDAANSASINGLVNPGLFNLNNSLTPPSASNSQSLERTLAGWGKFDVAFRNFLFLTVTGRNDWFSVLS